MPPCSLISRSESYAPRKTGKATLATFASVVLKDRSRIGVGHSDAGTIGPASDAAPASAAVRTLSESGRSITQAQAEINSGTDVKRNADRSFIVLKRSRREG